MTKRERERIVIGQMIGIYCNGNHHTSRNVFCDECAELKKYAEMRSEKCVFGDKKTLCSNCPVHCFKPEMREKIRKVMRYAGPRMIYYHPIEATRHLVSNLIEKHKMKKSMKVC